MYVFLVFIVSKYIFDLVLITASGIFPSELMTVVFDCTFLNALLFSVSFLYFFGEDIFGSSAELGDIEEDSKDTTDLTPDDWSEEESVSEEVEVDRQVLVALGAREPDRTERLELAELCAKELELDGLDRVEEYGTGFRELDLLEAVELGLLSAKLVALDKLDAPKLEVLDAFDDGTSESLYGSELVELNLLAELLYDPPSVVLLVDSDGCEILELTTLDATESFELASEIVDFEYDPLVV